MISGFEDIVILLVNPVSFDYNRCMNVFIVIMLIFAAIGFVDKALEGRWGLSVQFDEGLKTMGVMVIPIVSICTVGTEFVRRHIEQIADVSDKLFFDPSMIIGAILAPDMGGYFISREIAANPQVLILSGVVLGTIMGQAITFQLPVFTQVVDRQYHDGMFRGFLVGIVMIPAGLIAAAPFIRMPATDYIKNILPVLLICAVIAAGLKFTPELTSKLFKILARIVNLLFYFMFAVTVIGVFIPSMAYASMDSVVEAVMIVFKSAIIIAGALVMSELIMKIFRKQIGSIADRLGINEVAAVSLLMTCATSLAVMPLFPRMDEKGRQMVSAFSLSGSFVIGGSLAFVATVTDGLTTTIFVISKLVCGILSALVMHVWFSRGLRIQRNSRLL